ncbi:MAG: hypothetical protein IT210_25520 [Armatimonadetes bacterium]|nr:hypothetical protein [Armatimonadota bacterium]
MIGIYYANSLHAPWWRGRAKSGGQMVEQIIHTFDIIRHLLYEIDTVYARMRNIFHQEVENYTSEDVSGTVIAFKNDAVATVAGSNGAVPNRWLSQCQLVARRLTVYFSDPNNAIPHHTGGPYAKQCSLSSDKDSSLTQTLDRLDAIEKGGPTRTPMLEGAKSLQLVLAVRDSADSGQPGWVEGL